MSCVNIYRGATESADWKHDKLAWTSLVPVQRASVMLVKWHVHPAIIWLLIQKYLLPTPEQLHSSGCDSLIHPQYSAMKTWFFRLDNYSWISLFIIIFFIVCVNVVYEIATRNVWYNLVLHNDKLFLNLLWLYSIIVEFWEFWDRCYLGLDGVKGIQNFLNTGVGSTNLKHNTDAHTI